MDRISKKPQIQQFIGVRDTRLDFSGYVDALTDFGNFQNYCEYENKAWYSGSTAVLRAFYRRNYAVLGGFYPAQNFFWKKVAGNVSMVHVPIPSAISERMASILFGRMPVINADTPNQKRNAELDKQLDKILQFNDIEKSLATASQLESYSGTVAGKIIIDEEFDYPIIQWYPAEQITVNTKYGRLVEVCFRDKFYDEKNREYILRTFAGYGYIRYELWFKDDMVPLDTLSQTKGLKNIDFVDEDGKNIQCLMCVFKPNRVANNIFRSAKGSSDYEGLNSMFDSIDETASAMVDVIKKSRTYTFIPERMLAKDSTGRVVENQAYGIDVWDVNRVSEQNEKLPQRDTINLNIQPYIDSIRELTKVALNRVGISPASFGMDDAGANASAEALNIRDEQTEKTFVDKSNLWKPALERLAQLLIICNSVLHNPVLRGGAYLIKKDIINIEYIVTFPPYKEMTPNDIFKGWLDMIDNGAMTPKYAMELALKGHIPDADIEEIQSELGMYDIQENEETEQADGLTK